MGGAGREYGLPHQCAHWLAMTGFESAVVVGGGTHGCRPTGDKRGCGGQRRGVEDAAPYGCITNGAVRLGGGTHVCRPTEEIYEFA